ncbi:Retrovirus-related Pol polyprotein from transposon RE1 [Vitis vinifera]|uniref:Retrovirus-related Pol polyprotein from transposon RE1 n=1 Tax=Vitis vinifera TaxID=29760 RepID=A0A438JQE9_VITVI|nr:Retrovirus-related Pol polyprotein from transposon RE1 [Vitis vinifera]
MASSASFSPTNDLITIKNSHDPQHPLLIINLSNITKLSSTNYLIWSLQILSLLEGYDLRHFIDGADTPPPPTITVTGVASPNPTYTTWKRQDRLIFSALLGAISVSLQPLIARTTTSLDAWQTLVIIQIFELGVTLPTPPVIYCDNALFVLFMFPQQINLSTLLLNRFHEVASKNYGSRLTSPPELHLVGAY